MRNPETEKDKNRDKDRWMRNLPHAVIVGGMLLSLGSAIFTGLKKSKIPHIASSLSFVGFALTQLFIHQSQLSHRMKKGLNAKTKSAAESPIDNAEEKAFENH